MNQDETGNYVMSVLLPCLAVEDNLEDTEQKGE
jgi:hypothetical protein